jgi:hypothetical protein
LKNAPFFKGLHRFDVFDSGLDGESENAQEALTPQLAAGLASELQFAVGIFNSLAQTDKT